MGVWQFASRRVILLTRNFMCSKPRMDIYNKVTEQGDKLRELKSAKAEKSEIEKAVGLLKELKIEYEKETGEVYKSGVMPGEGKPAGDGGAAGDVVTPWDVQAEGDKPEFQIFDFFWKFSIFFFEIFDFYRFFFWNFRFFLEIFDFF